jgi:hypothetical protein
MPYSLGGDRLEKLDPSKIKKHLFEDEDKKMTADMLDLFDQLKPTAAVEKKRQRLTEKLEKLLNDKWPGRDIRVHLFGSSGNMLCSDNSDGMFHKAELTYMSAPALNEYSSGYMHNDAVEGTRGGLHPCGPLSKE